MIYTLTNVETGKKFAGKTNFNKFFIKQILFEVLDNGNHYNKFLQKDWFKYNFEIEIFETDDDIAECDKIINDEQLLNPIRGYNVYADLPPNRGRHRQKYIYNDDICLVWCFFPKIQFVTRTFDMQRNSISNRLSNFELYDGVYYSRSIARYEDFYWTSARLLYLEGKCLTANQILDRMIHRYDISDMLRITPRKISKFYVTNGIASKDDKEKGCLVFCPR